MSRPVLLTVTETAQLLTLRESTVRHYARRGVLPCVRIGRHLRFDERDLVAWVETLKGGAESP